MRFLRYILFFLVVACGFTAALLLVARLTRPDMRRSVQRYSPEQIAAAEAARDTTLDQENPTTFYREVDYSIAEDAPWYPRGEAPMLAELVAEGKLPPVAQRVGPEPVVLEGIEGVGRYGGTWRRLAVQSGLPWEAFSRLSYVAMVRWSPQGYPIVPHVAKAFEVSDDNRTFTFHLRKGMRWSDGHPFTADDIMFWWEHIVNERTLMARVPELMRVQGQPGTITKLDDLTIRITFPLPNGAFLARLAAQGTSIGMENANMLVFPAHYLRKFHPVIGDQFLIEQMCQARRLPSGHLLFREMINNARYYPDFPRLTPWVYRRYKANPPYSLVRNPYYFAVDSQGNQLPYIDQLVFQSKTNDMIPIAAAQGDVSMQARYIPYEEYTYLMGEREAGDYDVYHWYPGDRSLFLIAANLNYRVDPDQPETALKHELLNDVRFRQALSLAINRAEIIKAEYNGQAEAAQCAPSPQSFFHYQPLYEAFTAHDPDRANALLDEIGLTQRDYEGYRAFADGSRMSFYLNVAITCGSPGIAQMVADYWGDVGVRTIARVRSRDLFYLEKLGLQHEFNVWTGNGEFLPIVAPRYFMPRTSACHFGIDYARWFTSGGLYGDPRSVGIGQEPPEGHPCREVLELFDRACEFTDPTRQKEVFDRILQINAENLWTINVSTPPPVLTVVDNDLHNVPRDVVACWNFMTPGNAGIETYFFETDENPPGVVEEIKQTVAEVRMPDAMQEVIGGDVPAGRTIGRLIRVLVVLIVLLLLVLAVVRHPYIGRRLVIMLPTLLVISVVIFLIIQAPPGDYLTSRIMMLEEQGDAVDLQQIEDLRSMFWLDQPLSKQYARWMGLYWFTTFDAKDAGLLQGNLGRSMSGSQSVNVLVGDRIVLTMLISLGTILLTWSIAIPVGIYSAVRQYSVGDYAFSFISFLGMSVPSFLLALLLMHAAKQILGIEVSGLFSARYGAQTYWDWPKFVDLLKHVWLPVVVLGVGGTANMIRVMRGNLLDELRKPYVTTARAKGVRPGRLLFKYPVRMALNPFISSIGGLFPQLISGGAIVAMVLSLPTVGPLMLQALLMQDMYLAGSMLMVLSLLGVAGTLVSDLLLLCLDPRIRFEAGSR